MMSSLIFLPHSYSRVPPRSYSRALPHISSHALSHFSHGPNHRSNDFGSQGNNFVHIHFGCGPHPHRGDHFLHRPSFSAGESQTRSEPRHLDGPHFPHHGSHPIGSSGEALKTMKTSSGRMVKCRIPKIYLTNPSTETSTFSHSM
jgi:hypothetical protein